MSIAAAGRGGMALAWRAAITRLGSGRYRRAVFMMQTQVVRWRGGVLRGLHGSAPRFCRCRQFGAPRTPPGPKTAGAPSRIFASTPHFSQSERYRRGGAMDVQTRPTAAAPGHAGAAAGSAARRTRPLQLLRSARCSECALRCRARTAAAASTNYAVVALYLFWQVSLSYASRKGERRRCWRCLAPAPPLNTATRLLSAGPGQAGPRGMRVALCCGTRLTTSSRVGHGVQHDELVVGDVLMSRASESG